MKTSYWMMEFGIEIPDGMVYYDEDDEREKTFRLNNYVWSRNEGCFSFDTEKIWFVDAGSVFVIPIGIDDFLFETSMTVWQWFAEFGIRYERFAPPFKSADSLVGNVRENWEKKTESLNKKNSENWKYNMELLLD